MLSGGELAKKYEKSFIIVEGTYPSRYPPGSEWAKIAKGWKTVPLFVFFDSDGKEVLRTNGFGNPDEAAIIHKFVSEKKYKEVTYREYFEKNFR